MYALGSNTFIRSGQTTLLLILQEEFRKKTENMIPHRRKKAGNPILDTESMQLWTGTKCVCNLIRRISMTNTSVHESQIDLSEMGEVVYRDRGYQGTECKGYNATMKRGTRNHPIGIRDKLRNERITRRGPKEKAVCCYENGI